MPCRPALGGLQQPAGLRLRRLSSRPLAPGVVASAAAAVPIPPPPALAPAWPGAKPIPLLLSVGIGLVMRFLVPVPAGITLQAWTLLSIFVSTIAGQPQLSLPSMLPLMPTCCAQPAGSLCAPQ